ncbi:hypothetical protein [uncultured Cohaesibacter sp.]|uniref:hypothetical protein n=1 Tax=uncultured Cohaesibacter sp. TaxID=1002546 RepID=UPI00292DF728|nr:hypothetical protein [uncultured Cohaesibacter sp.]
MDRHCKTSLVFGVMLLASLDGTLAVAGGLSADVARAAMCNSHMDDCLGFATSKSEESWCNKAYDVCLEKGVFPMPEENVTEPGKGGQAKPCADGAMECRLPDEDAVSTYGDGTPVQGDPVSDQSTPPDDDVQADPLVDNNGVLIDVDPSSDPGLDMLETKQD